MGRADDVAQHIAEQAIECMRVQPSEAAAAEIALKFHEAIDQALNKLSAKFCTPPHRWHDQPRARSLADLIGAPLVRDDIADPLVPDEVSDPLAAMDTPADPPTPKRGGKAR